jgi:hypothetical protein
MTPLSLNRLPNLFDSQAGDEDVSANYRLMNNQSAGLTTTPCARATTSLKNNMAAIHSGFSVGIVQAIAMPPGGFVLAERENIAGSLLKLLPTVMSRGNVVFSLFSFSLSLSLLCCNGGHCHVPEDGENDARFKGRLPGRSRQGKHVSRHGFRANNAKLVAVQVASDQQRHEGSRLSHDEACTTQMEKGALAAHGVLTSRNRPLPTEEKATKQLKKLFGNFTIGVAPNTNWGEALRCFKHANHQPTGVREEGNLVSTQHQGKWPRSAQGGARRPQERGPFSLERLSEHPLGWSLRLRNDEGR